MSHNANYVIFLCQKSKPFYLTAVFRPRGYNIDPGGIDAAVSQDIRQLGNILFNPVKGSGKQFSQVVRENLGFLHTCFFA